MELIIQTSQREELVDITNLIEEKIKINEGPVNIFVPHATCGITINENADSNIPKDIINFLSQIVPKGKWLHDKIDGNGDAHIKTSIIGNSLIIPIANKKMELEKWQNIFLCEFDGPKKRKVVLSFIET
jgi:secondary thiamine-phosphate synthase enzyme